MQRGAQDTHHHRRRHHHHQTLNEIHMMIVTGGKKRKVSIIFVLFRRDTRLISIGGGADEVMLGIISKYMDMLPRK